MNAPHQIEDFATAPGETLLEWIEALGMSQVDLATRTALDEQTINLIIKNSSF
jgi:plasmid maintenance system antidote protein VapI